MNCEVRLFAVARQLAGADKVTVTLAEGATVADLRAALARAVPELAPLVAHMLFAVGNDYVSDESGLAPGAEVACIPPVSGG